MEVPATSQRVTMHTEAGINRKIRDDIERRLYYYLDHPEQIEERLRDLDQEWDIERTLEANAASVGLAGMLLFLLISRRFLLLPTVVCGFLLQHAVQGWCPPVPLFRHLGVRTQSEIDVERYALKALRGDFAGLELPPQVDEGRRSQPGKVMEAVSR